MVRRRKQTPSQKPASIGSVRIISGLWKGRKLPVHDAQGLRPTTDRVKETLFNWLAQEIPHSKCLDVFSGSGGLGFEAASRQAELVTMVELNAQAFRQIKENIGRVGATNIEVHHGDALQFLGQPGQAYDVVFIDPPFRQGLLAETIDKLESNGWLAENAVVYIETEKELKLPDLPEHWQQVKEKIAGQVCYRLFERNEE
jgi:16S rRNA (guanine966-N2)-methyltransferase